MITKLLNLFRPKAPPPEAVTPKAPSHTETFTCEPGISVHAMRRQIIGICETGFYGWADDDIYIKTTYGNGFYWNTLGQVRSLLNYPDRVQTWPVGVIITTEVRKTPFLRAREARGQTIN